VPQPPPPGILTAPFSKLDYLVDTSETPMEIGDPADDKRQRGLGSKEACSQTLEARKNTAAQG
jgi:hypothetical protein